MKLILKIIIVSCLTLLISLLVTSCNKVEVLPIENNKDTVESVIDTCEYTVFLGNVTDYLKPGGEIFVIEDNKDFKEYYDSSTENRYLKSICIWSLNELIHEDTLTYLDGSITFKSHCKNFYFLIQYPGSDIYYVSKYFQIRGTSKSRSITDLEYFFSDNRTVIIPNAWVSTINRGIRIDSNNDF